ncbi:GMC family oxidoreductase [Paroceanicella profunda]|uniref:GMC family oxidoreductase n=1 Tax=Paroceanicella profunda TaxID=2579971 RepID=A0A5B8FGP4_9RHOB|nr:GMC oxidoreductase [Paroceanicella profunda]QDL91481.1 GMC family oxidoreductase [Paroceanicella profunda]
MIAEDLSFGDGADSDVCVIGAGPVGLAVALTLARGGRRVLVLEAGGATAGSRSGGPFDLDVVNPATHGSGAMVSRQGLGGTATAWGGACTPMAEGDLAAWPRLSLPGAPARFDELSGWHAAAGEILGVHGAFESQGPEDDHGAEVLTHQLIRHCRVADTAALHHEEIARSPTLRISLDTRVSGLDFAPGSGAVTSLEVIRGTERHILRPKRIVLACGGVQATRLLLLIRRVHPGFLGGEGGPLGRYYMGHLSGAAARVQFRRPDMARHFLVRPTPDGASARHSFVLAPWLRRREGLQDAYFALMNVPLDDPFYLSGALSAVHLALALRHRTPEYMLQYHPGHRITPFAFGLQARRHLGNVLCEPLATVAGLVRIARMRMAVQGRHPFFQFYNPHGVYALRYHAEQAPDPQSRITLSARRDADGVPLARVDLRFAAGDVDSVLRSHLALASWMRASGLGEVTWHHPEPQRAAQVLAQASDGYHQIGSTRMSHSARTGVVDRNLRVHGVANLFVAGPSVLPASGRFHPTFPAVALGVRLAHHLMAPAETRPRTRARRPAPVPMARGPAASG